MIPQEQMYRTGADEQSPERGKMLSIAGMAKIRHVLPTGVMRG